MDATTPRVDPGRPGGAGDPLRAYRSWASGLFALLAALIVVVGVLALGSLGGVAPLVVAAAFSTALLGLAVLVALVIGLGRLAPWAIHAIRPVCFILVAFGVVRVIVGVATGTLTIPLEAIGAALVLSREHAPAMMPPLDAAGRRRTWLATGAFLVAQGLPLVGVPLEQGALFGASVDDLGLATTIDCHAAPTTEQPIVARVSWTWSRAEPFPPEDDGVLLAWRMTTEPSGEGDPADVGFLSERTSAPDTIVSGGAGEASSALAQVGNDWAGRWEWIVAPPDAGPREAWAAVDLAPSDPATTTGSIELTAWYAHGGRWIASSGTSSCAW